MDMTTKGGEAAGWIVATISRAGLAGGTKARTVMRKGLPLLDDTAMMRARVMCTEPSHSMTT